MKKPFSAYQGVEPYVFVCYAHEDAERVYPELAWLNEQGVNVWYDEGIAAGRNWRAEIGDSLLGAGHMLFYISANSLASDHCNREINLALDEGKVVVPVYLDVVPLTSDLKVGLNRVQALNRDTDREYRRQLLDALGASAEASPSVAERENHPAASPWRSIAVVAGIFAAILVGLWQFNVPDPDATSSAGITETEEASTTSFVDDRPSIAVLPFVNMSSDPEQEYFSDGLAEELINLLTRNTALRVVSRGSTFALKDQEITIDRIAEQLKVAHVLEGSVRKSGNMVRVTAMLTEAASGAHIWSESFDRPLDDVFAIQDEIATSVTEKLNVTLLGLDQRSRTTSTEAYLLYLRARHLLGLAVDIPATLEAERLLNAALEADPSYVPALTEMARLYGRKAAWGLISDEESNRLAPALLRKALEIDPDDAVAIAFDAWGAMFYEGDPERAARLYEKAVALNPNHEDVLRGMVPYLEAIGRYERALALAEYVVELDPLCVICIQNLGHLYQISERYVEAEAQFRHALSLNPNAVVPIAHLGQLLVEQGRTAEAQALYDKLDLEQSYTQSLLSGVFLAEGNTDAFEAALEAFRRRWPEEGVMIASMYAASGDADRAFSLLHKLADEGRVAPGDVFGLPKPMEWLDYLDDPRWLGFLQKIGADPELYAHIEFNPELPDAAKPPGASG